MSQSLFLSALLFYQASQGSVLLNLPPVSLPPQQQSQILAENKSFDPALFGIHKDEEALAPVIAARGAIVMDVKTQAILYQKNAYLRMPIASITKLFTVMTALDEGKDLSRLITIDQFAADMPASKLYLKPGDKLSLHQLVQASLIASANDATQALVEGIFGNTESALEKINAKVRSLGLINTHIATAVGFDDPDNYSTPFELAKAVHIMIKGYPTIVDIVKEKKVTITSALGTNYQVKSTNLLLGSYIDIKGLKTGTTLQAGESFVSLGAYKGREFITVVLNSPDRFQETKVLYEWVTKHYHWQ
ncbi:MAG: D-alanyl-D-alanine carboxypeptidase [Candidatus Abawacabacteria bacterium]|nr:D-alanyl-D-alanine carboxypeptidase [Candidatus Abawacabacteria bacterium]